MYFYVDESGHSGPNLFDPDQPTLYYGLLYSRMNVDVVAAASIKKICHDLGEPRVHASELGNGGLAPLAPNLKKLAKTMDLRFDIYRVNKPDHAIISFYDQLFDAGINKAVTWSSYWTPLRYVALLKLASLFDEPLARLAWEARIDSNDLRSHAKVREVCEVLLSRIDRLPDARSRQILGDGLRWGASNFVELGYNAKGKANQLSVMPNIIGFQSVLHGIASRIRKTGLKTTKLVVDQQSQFNGAQRALSDLYAAARHVDWTTGPGLPQMNLRGMPNVPMEVKSGTTSAGLQLVDVYLWIFRRLIEGKELAPELLLLIKPMLHKTITDQISLEAIAARWEPFFKRLPEPNSDEMVQARNLMAVEEERRQSHVVNSIDPTGGLAIMATRKATRVIS